MQFTILNLLLTLGIFTIIVVSIFLFQYRRLRDSLAGREKEMSRRMYQLSILRELGERIGYSLRIDQIVEIIAASLRRLLDYSTVSYMLISTTADGKSKIAFSINLEKPVNKLFIEDVKKTMLISINTLLEKNFKSEDLDETVSGTITDPTAEEKVGSFFNVPIVIAGEAVGILNIASVQNQRYMQKEVEILYTIMNQASDAVTKLQHVLDIEKGKLNSMVASMADGVMMIDKGKQLTVINPVAKAMLGLEKHVTIFDVLDSLSNVIDFRTKLEESIDKDRLVVAPAITLNDKVFQILITPVKDKQDVSLGAVVILHDVTKEKELEKMREDFTNMMVHELRSPLTGVRGIANLLVTDKVKNDAVKYADFVSLIQTNTEDMLGLVNDLLDVAKLDSGKFQLIKKPSDISELIQRRVASFKALADQNNLSLEAKIAPDVPGNFNFDEHKISQVLNNLISNSIKFTDPGGKVTVSAFLLPAGKDLAEKVVEQSLVWPGLKKGVNVKSEMLMIGVTDTGVGISNEKIGKLFNKFVQLESTAKSEKKGTGLGLVVSKGIIEAHQGKIGVFSEPGEGTTFYFTLPINQVINKDPNQGS